MICLWCITAILLGVVIGFGVPSIKKSNSWKTAIGTIIEVDSCVPDGYTNGVAEYTANENEFNVNIVCSGTSKEVGGEWEVWYDPSSPDMAVDGSFYNLWTIPLIFLIASIAWCIASLVFTVWCLLGNRFVVQKNHGRGPATTNHIINKKRLRRRRGVIFFLAFESLLGVQEGLRVVFKSTT